MNNEYRVRPIDIFIVGAQKAGTTSLLRYMSEHPEIAGHPQMEMAYLLRDQDYRAGYEKAFKTHFSRSLRHPEQKLLAKAVGLCNHEKAIERLSMHNPNCRLLFLLRNPVDRAYSSYLMEVRLGSETEPFEKVVCDAVQCIHEDRPNWRADVYLRLGMYAEQMKIMLKYFKPDAIKVVLFDELQNKTLQTVQDIFKWVGIDNSFEPNVTIKHNKTGKPRSSKLARILHWLMQEGNIFKETSRKFIPGSQTQQIGMLMRLANVSEESFPEMSDKIRHCLSDFYAPYNNRLKEYIQVDISHW